MFRILALFLWVSFGYGSYSLSDAHIDVVIPCHEKDLPLLPLCIEGAKKNVENVRRVIVISKKRYSEDAEWINERVFPFTKYGISTLIFKDKVKGMNYLLEPGNRIGWYFQQLLKLYAPLVIPDISENVLVLDSDTVFLQPVSFLNEQNGAMFCKSTEYHEPYFHQMDRLMKLERVYPDISGVVNHMLFQRTIIEDLFATIENIHQIDAWKALCTCIDPKDIFAGFSEYELYFNFVFSRTDQVCLRPLKWDLITKVSEISIKKQEGYDYVTCHHFLRQCE